MGDTQSTALPLELRTMLAGLASATVADDQQWILGLLRQHGAPVVNLLWRMLGREQDVLDSYQSAVCRLTAQGKDAARSNPGGYFYRVAMNAAIGILRNRRQQRRHEPMVAEIQARREMDQASTILCEQAFDRQMILGQLRQAILNLPPHLRDVIVLRDLAELPYPRVAGILGITVGTARLYRCQAVVRLADLIGEETTS